MRSALRYVQSTGFERVGFSPECELIGMPLARVASSFIGIVPLEMHAALDLGARADFDAASVGLADVAGEAEEFGGQARSLSTRTISIVPGRM